MVPHPASKQWLIDHNPLDNYHRQRHAHHPNEGHTLSIG